MELSRSCANFNANESDLHLLISFPFFRDADNNAFHFDGGDYCELTCVSTENIPVASIVWVYEHLGHWVQRMSLIFESDRNGFWTHIALFTPPGDIVDRRRPLSKKICHFVCNWRIQQSPGAQMGLHI